MISLKDSSGNSLGKCEFTWNTDHFDIKLYHSGYGSNIDSTVDADPNTQWYIKIEYTPGSGSDAEWALYAVEDDGGSFPAGGWGASIASTSSGSDTGDFERYYVYGGSIILLDDLRVDDEDVTY